MTWDSYVLIIPRSGFLDTLKTHPMLVLALLLVVGAAFAAADEDASSIPLPNLVARMPDCGWKCWPGGMREINCTTTDLRCLCQPGHTVSMVIAMDSCLKGNCDDQGFNVGYAMGEMCLRWDDSLPRNETEAASRAIAAKLVAATAATPSATAGPNSSGTMLMSSLGLAGAMVVFSILTA